MWMSSGAVASADTARPGLSPGPFRPKGALHNFVVGNGLFQSNRTALFFVGLETHGAPGLL